MERGTNMDNISVVFANPIDIGDLKAFAAQNCGVWQDTEPSLLQAHFPQTDGGVFLRGIGSQENDVSSLSSEERTAAQNALGIARAILTIDFSKNSKCRESATRIAELLAVKWGGFVMSG
jgi:hypothetical protein